MKYLALLQTLSIVFFVAKYVTILYILSQVFSGVGIHPPTWYYYPLLVLLTVAFAKLQGIFDTCYNALISKGDDHEV